MKNNTPRERLFRHQENYCKKGGFNRGRIIYASKLLILLF